MDVLLPPPETPNAEEVLPLQSANSAARIMMIASRSDPPLIKSAAHPLHPEGKVKLGVSNGWGIILRFLAHFQPFLTTLPRSDGLFPESSSSLILSLPKAIESSSGQK